MYYYSSFTDKIPRAYNGKNDFPLANLGPTEFKILSVILHYSLKVVKFRLQSFAIIQFSPCS